MSLNGKIVFITGASSGIGAATTLAFAAEGARLLLAARRAEKLAEVASAAQERGAHAVRVLPDAFQVQHRLAMARSAGRPFCSCFSISTGWSC